MAPSQSHPNGQDIRVNGEHVSPTAASIVHNGKSVSKLSNGAHPLQHEGQKLPNGAKPDTVSSAQSLVKQMELAPLEILQTISRDAYLPMARLITRTAQTCWDQLTLVVEELSKVPVPTATQEQNASQFHFLQNNQSKANLDKKDRLLNFANDQKADFIKLLVLLQWSRSIEDVRKTTALNVWLNERRIGFYQVIQEMAIIRKDSANFQVPNPDLETARDVLSLGSSRIHPILKEYDANVLTAEDGLETFQILNQLLCAKLSLSDEIPGQLHNYSVHDGRVTFRAQDEFEIDMSIAGELVESPFGIVDFRFLFTPAPVIPPRLHNEVTAIANSTIQSGGLLQCYNFFHSLSLSYRLNELYKQALELSQGFWSGHLKVELHRRTMVVQYWLKRPMHKTWFEIGIGSGRHRQPASSDSPIAQLDVRWMRDGKEVPDLDITFDIKHLSVESILRQVVARHINYLFDAIYEKISGVPVYAVSELELEQQSSYFDTSDCVLGIQLSKRHSIKAMIEPITGNIYFQPSTIETDRAQQYLNHARNLVDDFTARLHSLRSQVVELEILRAVAMHGWKRLQLAMPSLHEVRSLTHGTVSRVNFFRLQQWTRGFMLALTHSPDGDYWWLVHQQGEAFTNQFVRLKCRPLHLETDLPISYFGRLAVYASGMVVLHSTLSTFSHLELKHDVPKVLDFEVQSGFQDISFDLQNVGTSASSQQHDLDYLSNFVQHRSRYPLVQRTVSLCYQGLDVNQNAKLIGKARLMAKQSVSRKLLSAKIDSSITLNDSTGQLELIFQTPVGLAVVNEFLERLKIIATVLACVDAAQAYSTSAIRSLSLTNITIQYHSEPSVDLSIRLHFESGAEDLRVELLPEQRNPHMPMLPFLKQSLVAHSTGLANKVNATLSLLANTYPLVAFLQRLQTGQYGDNAEVTTNKTTSKLRVHVICRHLKLFAVQYFTTQPGNKHDAGLPPQFIARFEILPRLRGKKTVWLVRPAIEEFQSYNRPSFSSDTLREKVQQELFAKQNEHSAWLPLDGGAVCPMEQPEKLLGAIHGVISKWVSNGEPSKSTDKKGKAEEKKTQINGDSNIQTGANGQPNIAKPANVKRPPMPQQKLSSSGNKQQANKTGNNNLARPNQHTLANKNIQNNNDVITID